MYSDKTNINILTSLLVRHGIRHAVVCPGSRNGAIIHNLNECPDITCYAVTDERSAAFYALGMAKSIKKPVAVCVTSGSALLNVLPAVAEATYSHNGIVVISGDRPQAWIDQNDGQTIPQPEALGKFVTRTVQLSEPKDQTERWYCNRLVNEALCEARKDYRPSVHINVPISRPLFEFNTPELPHERYIRNIGGAMNARRAYADVISSFMEASRPMIVLGQMDYGDIDIQDFIKVSEYCVVVKEPLSAGPQFYLYDAAIRDISGDDDYLPEMVLYMGGTIVSRNIRSFLRKATDAEIWEVNEEGRLHDLFMNTCGVLTASPGEIFAALALEIENGAAADDTDAFDMLGNSPQAYLNMWDTVLARWHERRSVYEPPYSQLAVIKCFEDEVKRVSDCFAVHYANSMVVRAACIYADHYIHVNRGVNGIDGSISTAAGYSVTDEGMVYCVTGDLSFFYDQNALWNANLAGNLRILVVNNGGGGIFYGLPGLDGTESRDRFIAGCHSASAKGICQQNDIAYMEAHGMDDLREMMPHFVRGDSERPVLLEVFTDAETDNKAMKQFFDF